LVGDAGGCEREAAVVAGVADDGGVDALALQLDLAAADGVAAACQVGAGGEKHDAAVCGCCEGEVDGVGVVGDAVADGSVVAHVEG
jgi:hypothetical protein